VRKENEKKGKRREEGELEQDSVDALLLEVGGALSRSITGATPWSEKS